MANSVALGGSANLMDSPTYRHWSYMVAQAKQAQYSVPPVPTKTVPETRYAQNQSSATNQVQDKPNPTQQATQVVANVLGGNPVSTQDFLTQLQQTSNVSSQSPASATHINHVQVHNPMLASLTYAYNGTPSIAGNVLNRLI